jgi:hypothetical protein
MNIYILQCNKFCNHLTELVKVGENLSSLKCLLQAKCWSLWNCYLTKHIDVPQKILLLNNQKQAFFPLT